MDPRPEMNVASGLACDDLRTEAIAQAEACGLARKRFLSPDGQPTIAAAFAMGRMRALTDRSWATIEIGLWPCPADQRSTMEPRFRSATADIGTLVEDLVMDLAPTAPVPRQQVAHAVVRQIVVNALVHRSFAGTAASEPVRVDGWTDGFDIRNPADPSALPPNPLLHALAGVQRLATQQRMGLRYVERSARLVGWRATHRIEDGQFVMSVRVDGAAADAIADGANRQRVPRMDSERLVISQLGRTPRTRTELVHATGLPSSTVMAVLRRLEREGIVHPTRRGRRSRFQAYYTD